jgi:hypothetical protein
MTREELLLYQRNQVLSAYRQERARWARERLSLMQALAMVLESIHVGLPQNISPVELVAEAELEVGMSVDSYSLDAPGFTDAPQEVLIEVFEPGGRRREIVWNPGDVDAGLLPGYEFKEASDGRGDE